MAKGEAIARDATAARLLNLLFIFNATTRPITTEEIVGDSDLGYGSDMRDSDLRKFRRDRAKLAEQGIFIEEIKPAGGSVVDESSWRLDRSLTFASLNALDADDAQLLADAIDGYLGKGPSPLARPLRSVEEKAFEVAAAGTPRTAVRTQALGDPLLDAVWIAFALRRRLTFTYRNASGDASKRTVAIYGIFSREGASYFTGMDDRSSSIRTFRIDRVERAWRPQGGYTIPASFDVRDQLFFAFDLASGEGTEVTFSFPPSRTADELEALTLGRGTLCAPDGTVTGEWCWTVTVKDVGRAASFGLSHARDGMRPAAPAELVAHWNALVWKAVAEHVS